MNPSSLTRVSSRVSEEMSTRSQTASDVKKPKSVVKIQRSQLKHCSTNSLNTKSSELYIMLILQLYTICQ